MSLKLHVAVLLGLTAAVPYPAEAQIRGFFPPSDSIYIGGRCIVPSIRCNVAQGIGTLDTIRITVDEWSQIWYLDSTRSPLYVPECYFLVNDSLNDLNYQILYQSLQPPGSPFVLPFDSAYLCSGESSLIRLRVSRAGIVVDSMQRIFLPRYGLEVRGNKKK